MSDFIDHLLEPLTQAGVPYRVKKVKIFNGSVVQGHRVTISFDQMTPNYETLAQTYEKPTTQEDVISILQKILPQTPPTTSTPESNEP